MWISFSFSVYNYNIKREKTTTKFKAKNSSSYPCHCERHAKQSCPCFVCLWWSVQITRLPRRFAPRNGKKII